MKFYLLLLLLYCLLWGRVSCDAAFGFISTKNTAGDKCSACNAARYYYCTNPSTNVTDCYDDPLDCSYYPVSAANAPWISSQLNCPTVPTIANKTVCGKKISINEAS